MYACIVCVCIPSAARAGSIVSGFLAAVGY